MVARGDVFEELFAEFADCWGRGFSFVGVEGWGGEGSGSDGVMGSERGRG